MAANTQIPQQVTWRGLAPATCEPCIIPISAHMATTRAAHYSRHHSSLLAAYTERLQSGFPRHILRLQVSLTYLPKPTGQRACRAGLCYLYRCGQLRAVVCAGCVHRPYYIGLHIHILPQGCLHEPASSPSSAPSLPCPPPALLHASRRSLLSEHTKVKSALPPAL